MMIRFFKHLMPRRNAKGVKWTGDLHRREMSNVQVPEDEASERPTSRKGRLLKPRRKNGEEADLTALLREQLAKLGATPPELGTVQLLSNYRFEYEIKNEKLPTIQGRWMKEETDILKEMCKDHVHPRAIADRLGRKTQSVVQKIAGLSDYFRQHNEASRFEGPRSLPPEMEESVLRSRLQTIWEGLMRTPKTKRWDEVLMNHPPSLWQSMILEALPRDVVSILTSVQPPHLARIESLPWSETSAAGVFAWILKPAKASYHFDDECYVYIGSTARHGKGLGGRRAELQSRPYRGMDAIIRSIDYHKLDRRGQFVTLFEVPFADDSREEVERIRTLVTLAKAVLVIWLGAVEKRSRTAITGLVPWDIETISYLGIGGHNALYRDIYVPRPSVMVPVRVLR